MTYTYENLACNIQAPNLEHNLLKTGFLPITAMLLATKVGEMEWFPNEFQVDLLQHKTLCWHLEVGGFCQICWEFGVTWFWDLIS